MIRRCPFAGLQISVFHFMFRNETILENGDVPIWQCTVNWQLFIFILYNVYDVTLRFEVEESISKY